MVKIEDITTSSVKDKIKELKESGNKSFGEKNYLMAEQIYTEALSLFDLHKIEEKELEIQIRSNLVACHLKLEAYGRAIEECNQILKVDENHVKTLLRRARGYEAQEKYEDAIKDLQKVLGLQPDLKEAKDSLNRLSELRKKQQEQEMGKMLGQLKDLGNQFLGSFGISLDNFKMEKNENTGSYNLSYKSN